MTLGLNLEFARTENFSFRESLERASESGYRKVEPYLYVSEEIIVNSHVSLTTRPRYCHLDAAEMNIPSVLRLLAGTGVTFSAVNAHTSLLIPEIGIPCIKKAIDAAAAFGCGLVTTDEGPVSGYWPSLDAAFEVFLVSLENILAYGREKGVVLAIETHNALTNQEKYLDMLLKRFPPEVLGINFDTGNAFLSGNDPAGMLENLLPRIVHIHAKDIPEKLARERGRVTGTRVGTAIGEGVIDFTAVMSLLRNHSYPGVVSVECDTLEQARRSFAYLRPFCRYEDNPVGEGDAQT